MLSGFLLCDLTADEKKKRDVDMVKENTGFVVKACGWYAAEDLIKSDWAEEVKDTLEEKFLKVGQRCHKMCPSGNRGGVI